MKKENKLRLIFWGTVCGIVLIVGIAGFALFMTGHGIKGEMRKNLSPIVEKFNKLKGLEQYKSININVYASLGENAVIVNYATASANYTFNFNYETMSTEKVLHLNYSANDESIATIIVKNMIEAVSVVNGKPEGAVFEKHTLNDFTSTTIMDGVAINKDAQTNMSDVYINISKSILDNEELIIPDGNNASPENQTLYNVITNLVTSAKDEFVNAGVTTDKVYSNAEGCTDTLPVDDGTIFKLSFDKDGNITELYLTNSLLQYYYSGESLDINAIDIVNDITLFDENMKLDKAPACVAAE